jgi:serine/threonine-protein kinase
MAMARKTCAVVAVAAIQAMLATGALAQSPDNRKVTAEALFETGRQLVAAGKYAEACPKFADSQRLDASTATLLNLASCWENLGRTASAWETYREAQSAAHVAGRQDYYATAERHANALAPKLARITIHVPEATDGIQIERDGVVVGRAEWGLAIPVDTGAHAFAATAPGRKAWATTIDVLQDGAALTVTVPELEPLPFETPPLAGKAPPTATTGQNPTLLAPGVAEPSNDNRANGSSQRTIAWVVGGLGVVGLGVSVGFAVVAKNKYNDSLSSCLSTDHDKCDAQGLQQRGDARTAGDAATVALGLGAAAVVAGGILWFTAPHRDGDASGRMAIALAPTLGGAMLRGTW